ncbi:MULTISPECIES: hypothetical protein [Microcystis]|jgi:hypothetical protein|uniref:hypothetical protein n=1 Tax=Microcystis TaxID=1125 RepID=UPI000261C84E|nr:MULTISPECIES: hypothetical protein [Microcystis]MCA2902309.1 hypothetical protein [Microcystis sp. M035S1]KXS91779.1 hypothetical protein OA58_08055 [Microcystis aeruginosa NIES-88]MCA2722953.1 hypothetical protein [Microcystis sp. M176S2]MCA2727525.1 hypothetical protein [Microcystis sp. M166S2]MCA2730031.1 hypothetical protein [Microcystis sp. M162S2]
MSLDKNQQPQGKQLELPLFQNKPCVKETRKTRTPKITVSSDALQTNILPFMDMKKKVRSPKVKEAFEKLECDFRTIQGFAKAEVVQSSEVRSYIKWLGKLLVIE